VCVCVCVSNLQVAVVGVGDIVCAADRSERRRTVAATAALDMGARRHDDALGPERTEHRFTRICSDQHLVAHQLSTTYSPNCKITVVSCVNKLNSLAVQRSQFSKASKIRSLWRS